MRTRNFSKKDIEKIAKHLQSTKTQPCDCSSPSVSIFEEYYSLPLESDVLPAPSINLAVTRCENCGKVELIDPRVIDL